MVHVHRIDVRAAGAEEGYDIIVAVAWTLAAFVALLPWIDLRFTMALVLLAKAAASLFVLPVAQPQGPLLPAATPLASVAAIDELSSAGPKPDPLAVKTTNGKLRF